MLPLFLVRFATGLVGARFARPAIYAVLAILLGLALFVGLPALKHHYDRGVVDRARQADNANAVAAQGAANENAAAARAADAVRSTVEEQQIKEAVNEARQQGADPRAAYYRCVGLQQAARAAGRPTPAC